MKNRFATLVGALALSATAPPSEYAPGQIPFPPAPPQGK